MLIAWDLVGGLFLLLLNKLVLNHPSVEIDGRLKVQMKHVEEVIGILLLYLLWVSEVPFLLCRPDSIKVLPECFRGA
jgi:hypothetical protein